MRTHSRYAALLAALYTGIALAGQPGAIAPATTVPMAVTTARLPWPARLSIDSGLKPETVALKGADWSPMGTIEPVKPPIMAIHLGSWESPAAARSQEEDWALLDTRLKAKPAKLEPQFERSGGFLYVPAFEDEPVTASVNRAAFMFRFISARPPVCLKPGDAPKVVVERTWFALYDPLPLKTPAGEPPATEPQPSRGLVVFMPGMFGTPGDQIVALIRRLRLEGYSVLRMMSQPSRFTESITYAIPLEGDISATVPPIAADLTDRGAEAAYAVETAVLYAQQERPMLRSLPRVAIGMSGGAMLLPVVVAREPNAYAAAVSIAGGVDYLRILTTSNYANWIDAVRVKWTGGAAIAPTNGSPPEPAAPSAKRIEELTEAYRRAAPLDSANLAPLVKGIPWLILHATSDKAVPAVTGDELWDLLGKPERITVKGGHEWIFMSLSGKFNTIAEWLNKRVPAQPEPAR